MYPNTDEPPFPAVFILGPDPNNLATFLQSTNTDRLLVVHVHFNANGLLNGNLAIDQINIRHADRIQALEEPAVPGRFRAALAEPNGEACFVCNDRNTGMDPQTTIPPTSLQEEVVLELTQTMRRWGANGNLFNQLHPDPSTYQRVESGLLSGSIVRNGGNPVNMFNGGTFANGRGGLAFAPDGSLYNPFTRNGGDIVNTPGFYARLNGQTN